MTPLTATEAKSFLIKHLSPALAAKGQNLEAIADDFDLLASGVVDSLGIIELISVVEQHFKVSVDFEKMAPEELTIVGPFCRFMAANAVSALPPQ